MTKQDLIAAADKAKTAMEEAKRTAEDTRAAALKGTKTIAEVDATKTAYMRSVKAYQAAVRAVFEHDVKKAEPAAPAAPATPRGANADAPVYSPANGSPSFLKDLRSAALGNTEARERLAKHQAQVTGSEERAVDGTAGAGFMPPAFYAEAWSDQPRGGRVIADNVVKIPWPGKGGLGYVPQVETGGTAGVQSAPNGSVTNGSAGFASQIVNGELVTVAGNLDVTMQIFERMAPGAEVALAADLISAYDEALDAALITGDGSAYHHNGIFHVSGVTSVSYTDASPTGGELLTAIAQAQSQFYAARKKPANAILMHPRRAYWLTQTQATSFALFDLGGLQVADQAESIAGVFNGMRVLLSESVPTTNGGGTEDEIALLRLQDLYMTESPVRVFRYDQVGSADLNVRLQVAAFSQSFFAKRPQAIAVISGTGLAAPAGY